MNPRWEIEPHMAMGVRIGWHISRWTPDPLGRGETLEPVFRCSLLEDAEIACNALNKEAGYEQPDARRDDVDATARHAAE